MLKRYGGVFGRNPTFDELTAGVAFVDTVNEKTSGNGVTIDGVKLKDNNVVLAAGAGIDFSANSAATGVSGEILDDYETGTWTPDLRFSNANTGITYSSRNGTYVKVGKLVIARCTFSLSSKGSASGAAEIYGLPFALPLNVYSPAAFYTNGVTYTGTIVMQAENTTDRIAVQQMTEAGANSYLNDSNFSNTSSITLSVAYTV